MKGRRDWSKKNNKTMEICSQQEVRAKILKKRSGLDTLEGASFQTNLDLLLENIDLVLLLQELLLLSSNLHKHKQSWWGQNDNKNK